MKGVVLMNYNQNNFNGYNNGGYTPSIDGVTMRAHKLASSSRTTGILGLIFSILCCPIVGFILGLIAVLRARTAKVMLGGNLSDGNVGRVCGIIALVFSIAEVLVIVFAGYTLYLALLEALEELDSTMSLARFLL